LKQDKAKAKQAQNQINHREGRPLAARAESRGMKKKKKG
jgi:hypothetical protein